MLIRYARHVVIVAGLTLGVGGAGWVSPVHAAPLTQAEAVQGAPDVEGVPSAPGDTLNPHCCTATSAAEPIESPAIAEGDLGAAEGPGTADNGTPDLAANPVCPPLVS